MDDDHHTCSHNTSSQDGHITTSSAIAERPERCSVSFEMLSTVI